MTLKIVLFLCFLVGSVFLFSCGNASNQNSSNSIAVTSKPLEAKSENGTVLIEAAIVLKSGDVKPIARTEFVLLNKSFEDILTEMRISSWKRAKRKQPPVCPNNVSAERSSNELCLPFGCWFSQLSN